MQTQPKKTPRKASYKVQRVSLWNRKQRHCYYCEVRLTLTLGLPNTLTLDHKHPLSAGGADKPHNYVAACPACNNEKGSMNEAQYWQFRRVKRRAELRAARLAERLADQQEAA